jgi:hypothetical protein
MKKALYRRTDGQEPRELDILSVNKDGTFDLGVGEQVLVTGCPIGDTPGSCTVPGVAPKEEDPKTDEDSDPDPKKDPEPKDPKKGK